MIVFAFSFWRGTSLVEEWRLMECASSSRLYIKGTVEVEAHALLVMQDPFRLVEPQHTLDMSFCWLLTESRKREPCAML